MGAEQQLAGHADFRMTQQYAHLAGQVLVEALQTLPSLPANGNGHRAERAPSAAIAPDVFPMASV